MQVFQFLLHVPVLSVTAYAKCMSRYFIVFGCISSIMSNYVAKQVWKYKSIGHWSIGGLGKRWLEDQCRNVKKISISHPHIVTLYKLFLLTLCCDVYRVLITVFVAYYVIILA